MNNKIPALITEKLEANPFKYRIYGSTGNGQLTFTPWVSIIDKSLCDGGSTQKGIYPVFLFKKDMTGVYLSLNMGNTFFSNPNLLNKKGVTKNKRLILLEIN
ncbi:DUF3578 domain-containing protein [Jeotgalibacillus sp. ET6]|uniref:MrcB family domain-containing protein n=1 Tax=Jeotgalibacillus sp. ET6 TaxID=3037260 RepID=UPI0024185407|nr:DUF3578 domain-containing protein [Jeotgalibacillus sp. ET6]MDG5470530.1 DUF3578 domain-containing protein [Jeotgalibacillus sp. ET6]